MTPEKHISSINQSEIRDWSADSLRSFPAFLVSCLPRFPWEGLVWYLLGGDIRLDHSGREFADGSLLVLPGETQTQKEVPRKKAGRQEGRKPGRTDRKLLLKLRGAENLRAPGSMLGRLAVAGLILSGFLVTPATAAETPERTVPSADVLPAEPGHKQVPEAVEDDADGQSPELKAQREAARAVDRLERVIEAMRNAQRQISGDDTSSKTQALQREAVQNLQELLKRLERQQRSGQSRPQKPSDSDSPGEKQKLPPDQSEPDNSGSKPDRQEPGRSPGSQRSDGKSRDSEERSDAARKAAAEQARRLELIKDVWGHLPPHLREAMQNSFSEKYLPKYDELVKKYYESLAEKNRNRNRP
jgi:hypothetical protein